MEIISKIRYENEDAQTEKKLLELENDIRNLEYHIGDEEGKIGEALRKSHFGDQERMDIVNLEKEIG